MSSEIGMDEGLTVSPIILVLAQDISTWLVRPYSFKRNREMDIEWTPDVRWAVAGCYLVMVIGIVYWWLKLRNGRGR